MRGLYAIIDVASLDRAGLDPLRFAEACLSARPAALQLRDKSSTRGGGPMLRLLRSLAPMCRARAVPLFANDRCDLAAVAGCDGVHVGQTDLPVPVARAVATRVGPGSAGPGLVGISAHNAVELDRAIAARPDYIGLGPVFATSSKLRPDPTIGTAGLAEMAERVRRAGMFPVAIGGIHTGNAIDVARASACGAVIAGLFPPPGQADPYAFVAGRAAELHRMLAS
jgi:thiamine-phosphate pyrophosphorylase